MKLPFVLDFRLVIICCKEDEGSSLLAAELRGDKQILPPLPTVKSVQEYLRNHFANDVMEVGPDLPFLGATVDPDQ